MHLEHINLVVNNIEETLTFYQTAFPNWAVRGEGEQEWFGKTRRWLHFGNNEQYLVFCNEGEGKARDLTGHQIGLAHFAYVITNLAEMQARLLAAGFKHAKDGAEDPYRSNIYYVDPNGIEVEFVEYHSDLNERRNAYA